MSKEIPVRLDMPARAFSTSQRSALDALMDLMIPESRDGNMPAAASLGLYDDLMDLPSAVRTHFERGLDALNASAANTQSKPFAELERDDASALVELMRRDDAAFISAFTLHTTARYLQNASVMEALGLEARPNWPEGHEVAEGDWGLLEPVRQRGRIWREV